MKRFTESELWAFVNRADTFEKVATAENFLMGLPYLDNELYNDLMEALSFISRELYRQEREQWYETHTDKYGIVHMKANWN